MINFEEYDYIDFWKEDALQMLFKGIKYEYLISINSDITRINHASTADIIMIAKISNIINKHCIILK